MPEGGVDAPVSMRDGDKRKIEAVAASALEHRGKGGRRREKKDAEDANVNLKDAVEGE